jgi:hypothetical protein
LARINVGQSSAFAGGLGVLTVWVYHERGVATLWLGRSQGSPCRRIEPPAAGPAWLVPTSASNDDLVEARSVAILSAPPSDERAIARESERGSVAATAERWHGTLVTSRPVVDNGAGMLVRRVAAGIASALLFAVAVVPAPTHLVLPPRQPVL